MAARASRRPGIAAPALVAALLLTLGATSLAAGAASPAPSPSGGPPADWAIGVCTAIVRLEGARDRLLAMADAAGFEELDRMTAEAVAAGTLGDAALTALDAVTSDWYPGDRVASSLGDAAFALVDLGVGLQEADPEDAPTVRRALADAVRALAGIEDSRLAFASLDPATAPDCAATPIDDAPPLPQAEASPGPAFGTDPELEAAFPRFIAGVPVIPSSIDGAGIIARTDPIDLDGQDRIAILEEVAARVGRTIDDVSVGYAEVQPGDGTPTLITAVRIRGADVAAVADRLKDVLSVDYPDPQVGSVEVAGRTLTRISDGPYDPEGISEVLLPVGDILWSISSREPYLSEIVEALAGATP